MAIIYDDNFQSYAIGTNLPFGSWIGSGNTAQIQSGGSIIPGTDRHFTLATANAEVNPTVTGFQTSISEFVGLFMTHPPSGGASSLRFQNGTNTNPNNNTTLLTLTIEQDSTITARDGQGVIIKNTQDAWFVFGSWNFIQVNVTFADVLVSGVNHVGITLELGLNGVSVMSATVTTGILSSGLVGGTAAANRFQLVGDGNFAAYTLTTLQAIDTYPHPGTPSALTNHAAIELDLLPNSASIQVTHAALELDLLPNSASVIVYHALIELDLSRGRWFISES